MAMFKPCKHCGSTDAGFLVRATWRGPAEMWFDENGDHSETTMDRLYSITNETVRCGKCYKIRRDVFLAHNQIYPI